MVNILLTVDPGQELFEPLEAAVTEAINQAIAAAGGPEKSQIGLLIVSDEAIHELNKDYRGVDSPTDVLSFPLLDPGQPITSADIDHDTGEVLLGDIVISLPTAQRQAVEYGHSLGRETAYLAVHGALHLMGQDHEDEEAREAMRIIEESVLGSMGLTR
jgi:probable rRNA maturation factor